MKLKDLTKTFPTESNIENSSNLITTLFVPMTKLEAKTVTEITYLGHA